MKKVMVAAGMLILIVVGGIAVVRDPAASEVDDDAGSASQPAAPRSSGTANGGPAVASEPATRAAPMGSLPVTGEAEVYAAAVAAVVFGMDTRAHDPGDYEALLLGRADPHLTASGLADLERLLAERIPSTVQWARMRANGQWSTFEPVEVWEPGSWTQVVIAGDAQQGWVVRNVTGVQTTRYTEAGTAREAVRERSVTIAMRCPAPGAGVEACRLVLVGGSVLP